MLKNINSFYLKLKEEEKESLKSLNKQKLERRNINKQKQKKKHLLLNDLV